VGAQQRGAPAAGLGGRCLQRLGVVAFRKPRLDSADRFDANIANFLDLVEASKHYPCVKRHWVEYLGEHPEPSLDRVEGPPR